VLVSELHAEVGGETRHYIRNKTLRRKIRDRKTSRLPPVYYCFCAFYPLTDRWDSYTKVGRYDVRQQAEVPGAGQHHSAASSELAASGASAAKEGKIERSQIFLEIWPRLKNRLYDAVVLRESSCLI